MRKCCFDRFLQLLVLLGLLSGMAGFRSVLAQEGDEAVVIGKATSLYSQILGEERPLMIYVPDRYAQSETSYPVLYLLDGDNHFHHATATVQFLSRNGRMPRVIAVAIPNTQRARDLTPTAVENFPNSGGADKFLSFLEEELFPYVEKTYRTAPFRLLEGHSAGGNFAVYTLLQKPDLFDAFLAISPYLMHDDKYVVRIAEAALRQPWKGTKFLYMTVGGKEEDYFATLDEFTGLLKEKGPDNLRWKYTVLEDEVHGTTPLKTVYQGLEFIYAGWEIPEALRDEGLAGLIKHYRQLSETYGYSIQPPENVVNITGYRFLQNDNIAQAIELFQFNVKTYPQSANVYDSLGEAYEANQQFELARKNYRVAYQKGLENQDPLTRFFKDHLDEIEKKMTEIN